MSDMAGPRVAGAGPDGQGCPHRVGFTRSMATAPTIERKDYSDQRATSVMLEALRGRGGKLTRADAVAASGLPEDDAGRALTALLKQYRSHLSATASGELLYQF